MTTTEDLSQSFNANRAAQFLLGGRLDVFEDVTGTSRLILDLAETYAAKADDIAEASNDVLSGLNKLALLPKIGSAAKTFAKIYGKVDKGVQNINERVQDLETKLQDTAGTFLDDFEAALEKARELSDEGIAIGTDYVAAIEQLEAALDAANAGDPDLGLPADAIIVALDEITAGIGEVLDKTDPVWTALEAGAEGFEKAADELASLERTLCDIHDIAVQIAAPLQEIEAVLEPVDWAINASTEIFDQVVAPVLDPILNATGIDGLLDEFTSIFDPILGDLELLQDGLFEIDANFEVSFDAGVYTVPFLEDLFTVWQDIAPEFSLNADPFLDIDAYLSGLPNPPGFTFEFDPNLNFNLFSVPTIEFSGVFGDLLDLPDPSFEVDGPDGPSVYWLGLRNIENVLAATGLETERFGSDALIGDDIFILSKGNDDLNLGINVGDADIAGFATSLTAFLITDESGPLQQAGSDLRSVGRGEGNELEGNDTIQNAEFLLFTDDGLGLVPTSDVQNFQYTNVDGTGNDLVGADDNTAREYLIGDAAANQLSGLGGADVLLGGAGNDFMDGGAGDDLIVAGDGDDQVFLFLEAGDTDTIFGGNGAADRLFLEADIDTFIDLEGGTVGATNGYSAEISGFERASGLGGDDTIRLGQDIEERVSANNGDDVVTGVGFLDQASGNAGFDIVGFDANAWQGVQVELFTSTTPGQGLSKVVGVYENPNAVNQTEATIGNFEGAIGTSFSDYIVANHQASSTPGPGAPTLEVDLGSATATVTGSFIEGAGGNDVVVAGGGDDLLDGGTGFDIVSFNGNFGSGSGVTTSFVPLDINLETGIAQWTGQNTGGATSGVDTIANFEAVVGTQKNDNITGDAGDNALYGGDGNDTIQGGDGNDLIDGGDGNINVLSGGLGDDLIYSRSSGDIIDGGDGFDILELEFGSDIPVAELVAPDLAGDVDDSGSENKAGAEVDLDAQEITRLTGQRGDTTGFFDNTSTVSSIEGVYGTAFEDTLLGSSEVLATGGSADAGGANFFNGRAGDDYIDGRSGDDVLVGGLGSDTLVGGLGEDTLIANGSGQQDAAAADVLTGGSGADMFGIEEDSGAVLITDFEQGVDVIDIRITGATFDDLSFSASATAAATPLGAPMENSSAVTEVSLNGDVIALLQGVSPADLSADDFLIATHAGDDAFSLDLASGGALPDLLANDTESSQAQDSAEGSKITAIDGIPIEPGETVILSSGAEIVMAADGQLSLEDSNGVFAELIGGGSEVVNFAYTVTDNAGGSDTGGVEITLSNSSSPLNAVDDASPAPINEGTDFVDQDVLNNDAGQGLSIVQASSSAGEVDILPNGSGLRLFPDENFSGEAVVDYTIEDEFGERDTAQWRVDVTNTDNDAPETAPDTATTTLTEPVILDVLVNDRDPEGEDLTITGASAENGTVMIINDGTALSYVANDGFTGVDAVTYTASDGTLSSTEVANVSVGLPDIAAVDDSAATDEDTATTLTPLDNDTGEGLGLISASAANGTVTLLSETELRYLPNPDFNGQDTITYVAGDDFGQVDDGQIAVDVTGVNDAPVANPDAATAPPGTEIFIDVLANDTDADGDPLSVVSASAANGTVLVLADNRLSYLPDDGFTGIDAVQYLITDGEFEVDGEASVEVANEDAQRGGETDSDGGFGGLGLAFGLLLLLTALGGGF